MTKEHCPSCQTPFSGERGFVFCSSCGAPFFLGERGSPFEVLGVSKSFAIDEKALEQRYYNLSKRLHPDRFAASERGALSRSQELAATLNQAYLSLRQPEPRLEALLKASTSMTTEDRSERQDQIPTELAERYFELQEMVLEKCGSECAALIAGFENELKNERKELTERLYALALKTNWSSPEAKDIEQIIETRRRRSYIRSMLENLEKLNARL